MGITLKKSQTKKQVSKKKALLKKQKPVEESEVDLQLDTKPTMWDVIAPDGLKINDVDYGTIKQSLSSNTYFRPFYIPRDGYPRKLQTNWLSSMLSAGEVDLLIDIQKTPKKEAVRSLQRQITMLESNLAFQTKRGNTDQIHDLTTKIQDTDLLMSEIQFNENDSFNVSTLGQLYASSEKELNHLTEKVEDEMTGMFFKLTSAFSRVKKGFRSVLPLGKNEIPDSLRNMDRRALSTFAPFISGSGKYTGGVPLGINKITGQLEFINTFGNSEERPQNYNMVIIGISGSGKSVGMKLLISREMTGANIYANIIDPEGENVRITKRLGGINLNISEEEPICINPCAINFSDIPLDETDLDDEELELLEETDEKEIIEKKGKKYIRFVPLREKINEIMNFFDIIARGKNSEDAGLDVFERNYLEEALKYVFVEKLGITSHPDSLFTQDAAEIDGQIIQSKVRKPEPTISDIHSYLVDHYKSDIRAARLIAAIRPFLKDGSKPIFDGQTFLGKGVTQNLQDARLVNFNISQMEEGFLRPIAYHVILNYLWEYFVKNADNATKKKVVYCDEAWQLVDNDQTISFLEKMARRSRKRNAGLRIASQDFVRLLENSKARGILTNSYTKLFLKQDKIDLNKTKENFDLSAGERDILFGNPDQGEGILRIGKNTIWLQTNPSDEELIFIESNTAVLEELQAKKKLMRV